MAMQSTNLPPELARERDLILKYAQDFGLDCFETIFEMMDYDEINSLAALGGFALEAINFFNYLNRDKDIVVFETEERVGIVEENVGIKNVIFHA